MRTGSLRILRQLDAIGPRGWAVALGAGALLVRLPFMVGRHHARADFDDVFFIQASDALLRRLEFESDFYTPGYPAFQALVRILPGDAETTITIVQHLLGVAMVVAIVVVAWRWFGRATALTAGALAAFTPILVVYEHTLLPDFLFAVLVFAGAVALGAAIRGDPPDTRLLVACGILFGLATWVKPAGQFLLLAAPLAALLAVSGPRRALRVAAPVTLALTLTIAPWVLRNAIDRDHFGMSRQGGQTLFRRAFEVDGLPIPGDDEHAALAEEVRARSAAAPGGWYYNDFKDALIDERGLSWEAAIEVEREMALTAIRRHPVRYTENTWRHLRWEAGHIDDFERADELLGDLDRRRPEIVEGAVRETWSLARKLMDVWWLLSLSSVAGLLPLLTGPGPKRAAAAALVAVWVSLMLGTAMAHGALWRYSIAVAPITWILGSAGLVFIVVAVGERIGRARGGAVRPR